MVYECDRVSIGPSEPKWVNPNAMVFNTGLTHLGPVASIYLICFYNDVYMTFLYFFLKMLKEFIFS